MSVTYDPVADAMQILFCEAPVADSNEDINVFIFDYDRVGKVIGIEILDASSRIDNPCAMSYDTLGAASEHHIADVGILA